VQQRWDYPDDFMAWEPEAITVVPEQITDAITNVLEDEGDVVGFYVLRSDPLDMELSRLMIEPERIGVGYGRLLWSHAVETARHRGGKAITLDSDPNAEPFYRHTGAVTTGAHEWEPPMLPGWRVRKMRFAIPSRDDAP
jgi:GNAT superfamily N-acetyltransferase